MTVLQNARCPFPGNTFCDTDCMLSLAHVDDATLCERGETGNEVIACAFAVLASRVASSRHCSGNWLAKCVSHRGDAE